MVRAFPSRHMPAYIQSFKHIFHALKCMPMRSHASRKQKFSHTHYLTQTHRPIPPDMDPALDKLAAVSQVMFDQRILDLRAENEQLKCEVALLKYGTTALNHALAYANDTGLTEVCKCPGCFIAKRFSPVEPEELNVRFPSSDDADKHPCILLKCLQHHCAQLGLSCMTQNLCNSDSDADDQPGKDPDPEDLDCHIVVVDKGCLWEVEYGRWLAATTDFHNNPELPNLKKLFELLEDDEDFFKVGSENYYAAAEAAV